jgi:hypothetical protein
MRRLKEMKISEINNAVHANKSYYFNKTTSIDAGFIQITLISGSNIPEFNTAHESLNLIKNKNSNNQTSHIIKKENITIFLEPDWTKLASAVSITASDKSFLPLSSQYVRTSVSRLKKSSFSINFNLLFNEEHFADKNSLVNNKKIIYFILLGKGIAKTNSSSQAPDGHFFISSILIPALNHVCNEKKIFFLHAACLKRKKKSISGALEFIIICGDKNSGKTTMALTLKNMGFYLSGDDITLIKKINKSILLKGLNEPILVKNHDFLNFLKLNVIKGYVENEKSYKTKEAYFVKNTKNNIIIIFPKVNDKKEFKKLSKSETFFKLLNSQAHGKSIQKGACGKTLGKEFNYFKEEILSDLTLCSKAFELNSGIWSKEGLPHPELLYKKIMEII